MTDTPMSDDLHSAADSESSLKLTVSHRKINYTFEFPQDATISDLFAEIEASLNIPASYQKILSPKCSLLKMPFKDPDMALQVLQGKPLTLVGTPAAEVEAVQSVLDRVAQRNAARMARMAHLSRAPRHNTRRKNPEDSLYTFMEVQPLQGLPNPDRSMKLLLRLKEDPGIRATMRKHKFTVSLLTEMEPLAHTQTTHEGTSRILGLNRNQGEVIELRLRTDAHDGYRDYKTIRKTLCHELAHNVHGPHDRKFWDLCHQIEREVDAADWKSGGHTVGESSRHAISRQSEDDYPEDDGGWTGGEFVLGGIRSDPAGLSRREILANAATERLRREVEAQRKVLEAAARRRSSPPGEEKK